MATTTDLGKVRELSSGIYTAVLRDEASLPIPDTTLDTLTLSLYDTLTQTYINSRQQQDVLNANGVTIDGSGNLTWLVEPEDHVLLGIRGFETHRAVFEYTWTDDSVSKRDWHALLFTVEAEFAVA